MRESGGCRHAPAGVSEPEQQHRIPQSQRSPPRRARSGEPSAPSHASPLCSSCPQISIHSPHIAMSAPPPPAADVAAPAAAAALSERDITVLAVASLATLPPQAHAATDAMGFAAGKLEYPPGWNALASMHAATNAQPFASRPVSSALHTPSCPFRHIASQLQQFQECACQGPAIRLKTQREAEALRIQKELDSIVPPEGCPIAQQPVTLLALVCRCLNARDLVSTFKTCRQLCSAAQHPLTFQHGVGYLVDTTSDSSGSCKGVRSFGPNAVCCTLAELQTAMKSRLFKSFRILTLNNSSPGVMTQMLRELSDPAAPHLHSLSLLCQSTCDGIVPSPNVSVLGSMPSMQYLKTLSVHLPPFLESALSVLPPRLEVLQLIFTEREEKKKKKGGGLGSSSGFLQSSITETLRPLQYLRHLICKPLEQPQKSQGGRVQRVQCNLRTSLSDLRVLDEISKTVTQLESIGWFIPLDHAALLTEMRQAFQANPDSTPPAVRKLTQLRMTSLQYDSGTTPCDVLTCFPQLTEARFAKAEILSFATPVELYPRWNPSLARGLTELRVDSMAPAGPNGPDGFGWAHGGLKASAFIKGSNLIPSTNAILVAQLTGAQLSGLQKLTIVGAETRDASALVREWERLMRGGDKLDRMIQNAKPAVPMPVDLASMFQTMPQLRYLSIAQFELTDFNAFKHAPNLQTLKGVSWPEAIKTVPDDPRDLTSCFPSLTALSVVSSPSVDDRTAFRYREVLMAFPVLRSVAWKREKAIHPTKIEALYKESEAARAQAIIKREQLEREAAERSKEAHDTAMAMHKAGLAPLTEEQSWYKGDQVNKKTTVHDMEDVSRRLRSDWEAAKRAEAAAAAAEAAAAQAAGPAFSMDSMSSQFSMSSLESVVGPSEVATASAFQLGKDAAKPAASKPAAGKKSRVSGGGSRHSTTPAKLASASSFSTPPAQQQGAGGFGTSSFSFTSPSTQPAANALMSFAAAGSAPAPFGVASAPFAFSSPPTTAAAGGFVFNSPAPAPGAAASAPNSGFNFSSSAVASGAAPAPAFAFNSPPFVFNAPAAASSTDPDAPIPPPTFKF